MSPEWDTSDTVPAPPPSGLVSPTADTEPEINRPSVEVFNDGSKYSEPPPWARRLLDQMSEIQSSHTAFEETYARDRALDEAAFKTLDRLVQQQGKLSDLVQAIVLSNARGNGLSGTSFLFVEDDPDVGDTMQGWLERRGAVVQLARSLREARKVLAQLGSDAVPTHVLVDMSLPDGNGVQLCREVGNNFPSVRRILYTGKMDQSYPRGVCEGSFGKPFTEAEALFAILGHKPQEPPA